MEKQPATAYPAAFPAVLTLGLFVAAMGYAVLRYVVLGPVPADQVPLYIANKAVAVVSLALVALAFAARRFSAEPGTKLAWLRRGRRALGMYGLSLAVLHSLLSVLLLTPVYFGKFFTDTGTLTAMAGGSMLAGAAAMVLLGMLGRVKAKPDPTAPGEADVDSGRRTLRRLALCVLVLTGIHLVLMGLPGWLAPSSWHGKLPPITLISMGIVVVAIAIGGLRRRG